MSTYKPPNFLNSRTGDNPRIQPLKSRSLSMAHRLCMRGVCSSDDGFVSTLISVAWTGEAESRPLQSRPLALGHPRRLPAAAHEAGPARRCEVNSSVHLNQQPSLTASRRKLCVKRTHLHDIPMTNQRIVYTGAAPTAQQQSLTTVRHPVIVDAPPRRLHRRECLGRARVVDLVGVEPTREAEVALARRLTHGGRRKAEATTGAARAAQRKHAVHLLLGCGNDEVRGSGSG